MFCVVVVDDDFRDDNQQTRCKISSTINLDYEWYKEEAFICIIRYFRNINYYYYPNFFLPVIIWWELLRWEKSLAKRKKRQR